VPNTGLLRFLQSVQHIQDKKLQHFDKSILQDWFEPVLSVCTTLSPTLAPISYLPLFNLVVKVFLQQKKILGREGGGNLPPQAMSMLPSVIV